MSLDAKMGPASSRVGCTKPAHPDKGHAFSRAFTSGQKSSLPSFVGYEETLTRLAATLAKHFADPRIVGTGEMSSRGPWEWGVEWHVRHAVFYLNCGRVGIRLGGPSPCRDLLSHSIS